MNCDAAYLSFEWPSNLYESINGHSDSKPDATHEEEIKERVSKIGVEYTIVY